MNLGADSEAGVFTKINVMTRLLGISDFNAFKKLTVTSWVIFGVLAG